MKKKLQDTLIYTCGGFFVGLGILGVFLPVLQGVLFILLGLYIISLRSERAKRLLERILIRFPALRKLGIFWGDRARKVAQRMNIL